jgi:SAM-dependent methyltransferase
MTPVPVDEPLDESAPLALKWAPAMCRKDPATGESCAWNHGPWQFLRLAGLAMTPAYQADFYRDAIARAASRGSVARVLVSAAADYSMLAHALAFIRELGVEPEVTVVDLCETPLALNRWYAERAGATVRTFRSDILEYRDERPFDLVCTHSFLGRFTRGERPRLLARWRELLRPGGAVVTVNRVQDAERVRFDERQARAFRDAVLRAAERLRGTAGYDAAELARQLEDYARHPASNPLRSRGEFLEPFERTRFEIERISWAPIAFGARRDLSGPRVPGDAEYGRIVALRR